MSTKHSDTCPQIREQLASWPELGDDTRREIRAHAVRCPACARELEGHHGAVMGSVAFSGLDHPARVVHGEAGVFQSCA
ncbi:MAG: hypothetical protein MI919_04975 [Holophagales bacterium]|nr:hypothetical protein [Holophagales bacterium]